MNFLQIVGSGWKTACFPGIPYRWVSCTENIWKILYKIIKNEEMLIFLCNKSVKQSIDLWEEKVYTGDSIVGINMLCVKMPKIKNNEKEMS